MEPNIAFVAGLLADPSRAAMCLALVGGEARPASELAAHAGVSAQTASNHLARLVAGRILRVEQQGRWRYYRLVGAEVGHAIEALAVVAPPQEGAQSNGNADRETQRWLEADDLAYRVTPLGARALHALGVETNGRRAEAPARRCLDWTERRHHVAGPVGTALAELAFARSWVRRIRGTRAVLVTPAGRQELQRVFNVRF